MTFTEKIEQAILDCYSKIREVFCETPEQTKKPPVPLPANAVILADEVYSVPPQENRAFEGNNLIIGDVRSGKNRNYIYPNLMQMNSNYVVMDMHGECVRNFYHPLRNNGYEVQVFSMSGKPVTVEDEDGTTKEIPSLFYNPFAYIDTVFSIDHTAEILSSFLDEDRCDPLWKSLLRCLFCALIDYVSSLDNIDNRNFHHVKYIISHFLPNKDDAAHPDGFLSQLGSFYHNHPERIGAKALYDLTRVCETDMLRSILLTAFTVLDVLFPSTQLSFLPNSRSDELKLNTFRTKKKALFIVLDSNESPDLCALLLAQFFQVLTDKHSLTAEPVHLILNEFQSLPIFDADWLGITQKHNIMFSILVQFISQLGREKNKIIINCKNKLFLGGCDYETIRFFVDLAGNNSTNSCYPMERPYFVPDELMLLPCDEMLVCSVEKEPLVCKKYNPEKHPNYKQI